MKIKNSTSLKALSLTLAVSVLWLDFAWALDPRQKLLDDAEQFMAMQSDAPRLQSAPPLNYTFEDQNASAVGAQAALQELGSTIPGQDGADLPSAEPAFTLKTITGDLLDMTGGEIGRITHADGTVLSGLRFDADGKIIDADLKLDDGTIQLARSGGVIASRLPDGTDVFYDSNGRVEKTASSDGKESFYDYELAADGTVMKTTVTSEGGISVYDSNGRVLQTSLSTGMKIIYDAGVLARVEENGFTYRYAVTRTGDRAVAALESITAADGKIYEVDEDGKIALIRTDEGMILTGLRWENGAVADADIRLADGSVCEYRDLRLIQTAGADGSTVEFYQDGPYLGYAERTIAADGTVTRHEYALDVQGNVIAAPTGPAQVAAKAETVTLKSVPAISYSSNPSLRVNFELNSGEPGSAVTLSAYNSQTVNILLKLKSGSATYSYGKGRPAALPVSLSADKTYTAELRWESAGVGIYVYEAGAARPAAPLARIASKKWNPKFSAVSNDAEILSYLPSAGAYTRTFSAGGAADTTAGQISSRTAFSFVSASSTNKVVLTAAEPQAGLIKNTYTATWLGGRWTLKKTSYNSKTKKTTTTSYTLAQAIKPGVDHAAELVFENGKIALYSYPASGSRPAVPALSAAALSAAGWFGTSAVNAVAKTAVVYPLNAAAMPVPSKPDDSAVRTVLGALTAATAAGRPEVLRAEYLDGALTRVMGQDGSETIFENGLLKSAGGAGFGFETSVHGNLLKMTVEASGLKTSYDAKGRLASVGTADQTVFYSEGRVTRVEKADGTRIEDIIFDAAVANTDPGQGVVIREATVRLPDGTVRRYREGQIQEERKPDGTVTTFADGRPMETRMSDGRIYAYAPAAAAAEAASPAAVLPAAYEMILRQHRTSSGDVVELASADGIPVRVTRANGDVLTDMTFGQTGELQNYILSTRDTQGTAWNLTLAAGELIRAQSETGKTVFYEKNRLTRITEPGQPDISLSYGSDTAGNVYTTRVTKETDVRVYDAAGKLIRLEADGLSVDYDAQGIAAISNGVSTYLKPVFAADGSLVSGRIRSYNGTIYTIAGGRLTHVARPDGVEIGLDEEGYTTSFVDGNGQASFDYLRDTDGTVRDIKAVFPDGSEGEMTDLFEAGLNPGYWPVEGLEGWSALTKYSESQPSYARLASGGIESIYNNRPASDTVSRVHLSSASLRSPSDRLGAQFYFDGYKNVMVKQGGFIYVKFRVENAPALTSVRVRPGFGGSGVFDDMAREFSVDNGVVTAMIPITRTTGAPVNVIYIDFVPAQTSADAWTLAVENAGYFELAVTSGSIHEPSLFLADDSRTLIQTAMTASRVPAEDAWRSKTVQFNRIIGLADAPVRMTVDVNGEALESVTAEGIVMGYTDGRAGRVTSTDGAVTEYIYDADGKVASVTTIPPDGEPTTARYAYGKIREVVSADGAVVYRYSYEFEGDREFTVISDVRANEVKRYSEGRLLSSADAQGILTTYSYAATAGAGPNAEARIASSIVTRQGQALGRYVYSYEGDQTHITDEAGLTKIYNSDGELIYLKTAEGFLYKKSDYTDGSGSVYEEESLYSSETAEGVTLYYKEDTVDKIVLKDGTVLNVGAQENAYRNVLLKEGLVDEVSHEDGSTVKYLRDEIGRLQYIDVTRAGRIYRYDTAGALVRITDPADRKTLDFGFRRDEQGRITGTRVMERVWSPVGALNLPVVLRAASYGYVDGWNSSITVDGVDYSDFNLNIYTANKEYRGRGWSIAHIDASGNVIDKAFFDVYPDTTGPAEAERMAAYLEAIPEGDAVIMAVADEGVKYLSQRIRDAIQSFGSVQINGLAYRDSFALIGQKGAAAGSAIETLVKAGNDAAFASNVATRIYYYDETGLPITYDEFAASPELSWSAYHSFESEPEIEVFAVNGNGAAGWRKNFNPAHPDSGFIYLWDGMSINNEIVPTYESDAQNKAAYTALTPHVPISGRYVYYDPQYPTSNTYGFTLAMLSYLTSIGYQVVGAADLKDFFENHGSATALVMLQSIMPDTVYDPLSPYSISQRNIPRDYMEKGGTIVWTHDMPFYYAGHQGGAVTTIGEKGIRRMLGVIPTTRLNRTYRIETLQAFDEDTEGFSLLGAGVGHHSGAVRFDIPQGALSSRIEATDTELPTAAYDQTLSEHIPSYSHFEGVNRSVDVRVEEGSSLSVGFTGLDHAGGSPVALSVRFEESGQVNAYVQAPEGGVSVKALNYVYTAGGEYTVELREKGYWTDIYIYRMGDPRPVAFTGSVPHALWKNGTFFAEGHKGHSDVLATRMDASWWGYTRADGTVQPVHEIPVDQPALDESILSYDFNINYRNVSWSAVKSQLGGALKPDTSIVVTYDADGRLVSLARADKTVLVYEPGSDRLDAVYDLAGYLLTDYVYDEAGELIEVTNEGQRRALDEALYDARRQVSIQKAYALQDQAMEAGLITQSFLDQVNPQRAQLDAQRAQVQNSLSDLEGQKMKGSKAKKAKSEALDELRDALRQIDQARAAFEENVANQLAQLSSALNGKKLGIERDFEAVFNQLEAQFEISTEKIAAEERRAFILDAYRTNLGRDPTEEETARSLELSPAALKAELVGSPEHASRLRKKSAILSLVFDRLDAYLNAADGSYRAALLAELGLAENETVNLTAQEIAHLKTYLNSQSLHFGESAIDPLVELLKSQGQIFDEEQKSLLASRLILIDILSGQIHPFLKEGQEMLLSLHALQKTSSLYGITSQGYKVSYEDLISLTQVNLSNRPILHVEGLHYINLISVSEEGVQFLDNGEVKHLSKEDFLKVWQGTVMLPEAHAPPALEANKLSEEAAKDIKGAFFFLIPAIIGAIGSITAAIGGIIASITGLLAGIGSLISNIVIGLGNILGGVLSGITSLTQTVFAGIKFAGTHLLGGGISGLFAPATQGGFFGVSLNTITAGSVFKSAISVGINYGLQRGLDALGVNPGISSILTGFVTGGFLGGVTSQGFNGALFLQEGLKSAVRAGSRTLLAASGLDSTVGDILSTLTSAPEGSGGWQGNIGGKLITINPTIVQNLASYGIQKLGSVIGLNPSIARLIGSSVVSTIGGILAPESGVSIISTINEGLTHGAVEYGIRFAAETISPDNPLFQTLSAAVMTRSIASLLDPNGSILTDLLTAAEDYTRKFVRDLGSVDFQTLIRQEGLVGALEARATYLFSQGALEEIHGMGGIANLISGRAVNIDLNGKTVTEVKINAKESFFMDYQGNLEALKKDNVFYVGRIETTVDGYRLMDGKINTVNPDGSVSTVTVKDGLASSIEVLSGPEGQSILKITANQSGVFAFSGAGGISDGHISYNSGQWSAETSNGQTTSISEKSDSRDDDSSSGGGVMPDNGTNRKVDYTLLNGIRGSLVPEGTPTPYFDPEKLTSFVGSLRNESVSREKVDVIALFEDMVLDPLNPFKDLVGDMIQVLTSPLGLNKEVRDVRASFRTIQSSQAENFVPIAYSGGGQPMLKVLNEGFTNKDGLKEPYNVETAILVGSPILFNYVDPSSSLKRIINIYGQDDEFNQLGLIPKRFSNDKITVVNIELLGGVHHMDYFFDPDRPDQAKDSTYYADAFIAYVAKFAKNDADLQLLVDDLPQPNANGIIQMHPNDLLQIDVEHLKSLKRAA